MFDPVFPYSINSSSSIIDTKLLQVAPNPYSLFFDPYLGNLTVVRNSQDNYLYESISNTGYLELNLDGKQFSSDPNSQFFYTGIAKANSENLTSIHFDGGEGRDSLFIGYTGGNQTVKSFNIQTEDDLIIAGNISVNTLTTQADKLTVKDATITATKDNIENNAGGIIHLFGNEVNISNSNLNASGNLSGGTILIGGDYQGQGAVQNAKNTFFSKDSTAKIKILIFEATLRQKVAQKLEMVVLLRFLEKRT
jgi:hypothetical protein